MVKEVRVGNVIVGASSLVLIAGPDVIESQNMAIQVGREIRDICDKHEILYIFKSSYRKDNRSSIQGFAGPGIERGIEILEDVRDKVHVPVTSDVHSVQDIGLASTVLDMIQIPAFLCKQTSLLIEAAKTGKPINVKKGQFMDPYGMRSIVEKIESQDNHQIILTERGTTFGYFLLVNDFRALPIMRSFGYPVTYDVGHSIRHPGIPSEIPEGGQPYFIPPLTRAALAAGCDALFIEVHPDPSAAPCDGSSQIALTDLEGLVIQAKAIYEASRPYWVLEQDSMAQEIAPFVDRVETLKEVSLDD